ncbi:MAG TPA: hypothetical protein VFX97_20740 [Pyrinomonadaceae bacterium]|nr:hypothetical protein [Pyrinomonadaceae bacterium]
MTIKAVFRVQCDGPCKGWLSLPSKHHMGHEDLIVRPTTVTAGLWPGERAARTAALNNGWEVTGLSRNPVSWLCPTCRLNPLDIRIPHGRLGARCIVTGKYASGIKGIPYSSIDVPVDMYQDKQLRYSVEHDVTKHFEGHTAGTEVTDIEIFWVWMPDGDRILELDPDDDGTDACGHGDDPDENCDGCYG